MGIRKALFAVLVLPAFAFGLSFPKALVDTASFTDTHGKEVHLKTVSGKKGSVWIFLSAQCPCSRSHAPEISELKNKFPDFDFVGIHANLEEMNERSRAYFSSLDFSVIEDKGQRLANAVGALKTPHVFVWNSESSLVYSGAMDDSQLAPRAKKKYLVLALEALEKGEAVTTSSTRPLGCVISR